MNGERLPVGAKRVQPARFRFCTWAFELFGIGLKRGAPLFLRRKLKGQFADALLGGDGGQVEGLRVLTYGGLTG